MPIYSGQGSLMGNDIRMISASLEAPGAARAEQTQYTEEVQRALAETENALSGFAGIADGASVHPGTWQRARQIVEDFRPVPWFIWRISNFVFGTPGEIRVIPEGLVFGLRRLLFAAASDSLLGGSEKVTDVATAMRVLPSDVIAAASVIHALCRKLASKHLERMWRPILDDSLIRAQIGHRVGAQNPNFGAGRGMLAGFAGRVGFAILLATGDEQQAQAAMEKLAVGVSARDVGVSIYGCDPIQVSAMTLSAAGCGRDCAFGMVSYAIDRPGCCLANQDQAHWLAAFAITENVRLNTTQQLGEDTWEFLNFLKLEERTALIDQAKNHIRRGHGWQWML
jgi:hypothetical protein